MQVTLGTAVGVDLDRVRPAQNLCRMGEGKMFSHHSPVNNVKSKGLRCSFIVNTKRDLGQTKVPFNLIFFLQ